LRLAPKLVHPLAARRESPELERAGKNVMTSTIHSLATRFVADVIDALLGLEPYRLFPPTLGCGRAPGQENGSIQSQSCGFATPNSQNLSLSKAQASSVRFPPLRRGGLREG